MAIRSVPGELADAAAGLADALQVLVLSVELCQRDLDPRWDPQSNLYAVNNRLLAIADEMRSLLQQLGREEHIEGDRSIT